MTRETIHLETPIHRESSGEKGQEEILTREKENNLLYVYTQSSETRFLSSGW